MSSLAPAQLMGYSVQFPRALLHLLNGKPDDRVCIEYLGDVATIRKSSVISEEDKTSTNSNPVTDKSVDLWKTLYNWIKMLEDGILNLDQTSFVLYSNKAGRKSIVNSFNQAETIESAKIAIETAKETLKDIDNTHDIYKYYEYVMFTKCNLLEKLIPKFSLEIDPGLSFQSIKDKLIELLIGKHQIDFVSQKLLGWTVERILSLIEKKEPAVIEWNDYQKEFLVLFERARTLELIDFALLNPPTETSIKNEVKVQPIYLKRLTDINVDENEIVEAVNEFIRAKINREKWIENEIIDEDTAADFQKRLLDFWTNKRKTIELTNKQIDECGRGQILLYECKIRQENLRDMTPPAGTISGTYHTLVNSNTLGWHPKWKKD